MRFFENVNYKDLNLSKSADIPSVALALICSKFNFLHCGISVGSIMNFGISLCAYSIRSQAGETTNDVPITTKMSAFETYSMAVSKPETNSPISTMKGRNCEPSPASSPTLIGVVSGYSLMNRGSVLLLEEHTLFNSP